MQLTQSFVIKKSQLHPILLQHEELIQDPNAPFFLLIYSTQIQYTKITIYPITAIPVGKLVIMGKTISQEIVEEVLSLLQDHSKIIHTSGLVSKKTVCIFEVFFTGHSENMLFLINQKFSQIGEIKCILDLISYKD